MTQPLSQNKRLLLGLLILLGISGLVLALEMLRSVNMQPQALADATLAPGAIPIYLENRLVAAFAPDDLSRLKQVSFVDAEEGKTQEGWLLYDVLRLYLPEEALLAGTRVRVSCSSSGKSAELTWDKIAIQENMVMFDLSGRGTLKLVSKMEGFSRRDQWVQDTDRIEVFEP
jgi:hypothetical protein